MKNVELMKRTYLLMTILWMLMPLSVLAQDFVVRRGDCLKVYMPSQQRPVAYTALEIVGRDLDKVLSATIKPVRSSRQAHLVLELDRSLPVEGFRMEVRQGRLYISGADAHGLAYGLLELSRKMGVSPWEYWADCTPRRMTQLVLPEGLNEEQHPAVRFRGIFINDEDWGLLPWATSQEPEAWTVQRGRIKGAVGPKVTERIFQLMLRLRANYYWPPMHECSQPFFTIAGNREVAAKYGVYVGGSHCEPMATSPAAEWELSGTGDYNYVSNAESVKAFWQKRLDAVKEQEIVYTIGMRGVHDGAMQGVKTKEDKLKYLQQVIDDQREMLKCVNPQVECVPQVFVPYKEVLDIYQSGLQVPEDVTLMWTDDNYGYIRHFPDSVERTRSGGNGVYYHVSYWGRPHDYLWLNSLSPDLLTDQMMTAYRNGIRQMWILNVGDIKPSEYQIELFMNLAWYGQDAEKPLWHFVSREFGLERAQEIADVMQDYFRLSAEMKPEHMAGTRVEESDKAYWSQIHPIEGDWTKQSIAKRVADYQRLSDRVEELSSVITSDRHDAFYQLIKYPVQAAAQMNFKFLCPQRCEQAYDSIQQLTNYYNQVCADGKWKGIMDASPRRLPVFARVRPEQLPVYPDSTQWVAVNEGFFNADLGVDSVWVRVDLEPNHPIENGRLAFRVECDDMRTEEIEYQTVGRSEEWKKNVLRGYASRLVKLPVDKTSYQHRIVVIPMTPGVKVHKIWMSYQ